MKLSLLHESMWDTDDPLPDEDKFAKTCWCGNTDVTITCGTCDSSICNDCMGQSVKFDRNRQATMYESGWTYYGLDRIGAEYVRPAGWKCQECNKRGVNEDIWDTDEPLPDADQFRGDECGQCGTTADCEECSQCGDCICGRCVGEFTVDGGVEYYDSGWVFNLHKANAYCPNCA